MISLLKNFSLLKIGSSASNCCSACLNFSSIPKLIKYDPIHRASPVTSLLLQSSASYSSQFKARDRRELLKTVGQRDEGVQEDSVVSLDAIISSREDMFTDERTPNLLFRGKPIYRRSGGLEGFKHCRKGTNVAGQAVGLSLSAKGKRLGITDVRIKIQGLGPGRMASIKGIQMGGLNIISVTDDTRISFRPSYRPRKAKRL